MVNAFVTIKHGPEEVGTLHLVLYHDVVPRTVKNFMALLEGSGRLSYRNSISHRLIRGFMAQFGDITNGDGTGGDSIYGSSFADENFMKKHDRKGILSMANSGKDTNSSQFFISFSRLPHLDGKHVVFGHVDLERSASVLDKLEKIETDSGDKPLKPVVITDCGVVIDDQSNNIAIENNPENNHVRASEGSESAPKQVQEEEIVLEEEPLDEPEDTTNMSKSQILKHRLRKIKMKMNQARQLNRKALMREGEEMGSEEGKAKLQKQKLIQEKKMRQEAWEVRNAMAVKKGEEVGVDAKYLTMPADTSVVSSSVVNNLRCSFRRKKQLCILTSIFP
jgi:cyclophilin family peptidyl-prolyl cis-trans isomerase